MVVVLLIIIIVVVIDVVAWRWWLFRIVSSRRPGGLFTPVISRTLHPNIAIRLPAHTPYRDAAQGKKISHIGLGYWG
jgi:branched-subunit amino acid transport protein AzlD